MVIFDILRSGFRLAKTQNNQLIRGLYWTIFEGFLAAIPSFFLYLLLQATFQNTINTKTALLYGLVMAVFFLARIVAGMIGAPLIYNGAFAMMGEARLRLADHLRKIPMGWFGQQKTGDLGARLTSDMEMIEQIWSHFLSPFVAGLAMPFFLIIFLAFIEWQLALILLIGLVLAGLALILTQRQAAKPAKELIEANSNAQSMLIEYVQGIAVIRSFGRLGSVWQKLDSLLAEQLSTALKIERKSAPFIALFGFVLEASYLSLVLVGAWWLGKDKQDPAELLIFLVLAIPVYRQIFDVGLSTAMLKFAHHSLQRIDAIFDEATLIEPQNPKSPKHFTIAFDKVSFSYQNDHENNTLHDVSCIMPANELTAVVGPSGAGKTSFVHLIARLWDVSKGSITIGDIDLRDIGTQIIQQNIAMVFQEVLLFSGSVLSNIAIGNPDASREDIIAAAKLARADDFIKDLPQGYDTILDENGLSLSGGERQRLSIARAILKNAPILLLDEASASLDPSVEILVQQAMSNLVVGRTTIVIAHRLKNVRHAKQILLFDHGKIIDRGDHESLLKTSELYQTIWSRQQMNND